MRVGDLFTIGTSVDTKAPGAIATVSEVELHSPPAKANWLPGVLGLATRPASERTVVKILREQHLNDRFNAEAIRSLANEAQLLERLQDTWQVTPLLGAGFIHARRLSGSGQVEGHLSASIAEFVADVEHIGVRGQLPFLLLGNVPFEWSLLAPFQALGAEQGFQGVLRFGETIEIAIGLLRFLDKIKREHGIFHYDMKLEHVAWREGCVVVIDRNLSQAPEDVRLYPTVLEHDLRRLFIRVLYPLLTGKDVDGNDPSSVWGHIGDPGLYPDETSGLLPFTNVTRLLDPGLRRWLSRGLDRPERTFSSHAEAADALEVWLSESVRRQPLWPRIELLAAQCVELEVELASLWEEARRLRREAHEVEADDPQFERELERLSRGLARFRAARPFAITRHRRVRLDTLPWTNVSVPTRELDLTGV